jgi:nicotinate-nucleotide--dimethylbenzimidazole phosphoribosyltransferase
MIEAVRTGIVPTDHAVARAARERIDALTKPLGSLGRIEALAVRLCAIVGGTPTHAFERRAILIGAGDHGVADDGVSAYPSDVTAQMVGGFLAGSAAISAFARVARADVYVANFGVREALAPHPRLLDHNVGRGTANLARGAAIRRDDLAGVIDAGVAAYDACAARAPFDVIALGEMGIGNTTAAAALVAGFTGEPIARVVGRGTGIDDEGLARKTAAIAAGLARCHDFTWDELASEVGGYEIVALAGVMLRAAQRRIPIVLDGVIVAAAALIAVRIAPATADYLIASHRSCEPGHAIALAALGLEPLLDLELRLGEASGAALALPLIEAAARMVREMKTFAEAGVATAETRGPVEI